MTLKGLMQRLRRAVAAFVADRTSDEPKPFISDPGRIVGLSPDLAIQPTARLIVDGAPGATGRIVLGHGIYLGRFVEVATTEEGLLTIGDDTSIQDYSVIIGDVSIGAHCLLSLNVHITSSTHHIRHHAPWLIRDQDAMAARSQPRIGTRTWPVTVEDDCWIGWGVVILPGVYIGRGAVIGANSVVTRDVPPYEVHAGAPNARVGTRLEFAPGTVVDALDDDCLPYFYRGFRLSQSALARSRPLGVVEAVEKACVVLAKAGDAAVRLCGRRLDRRADAPDLAVRINGTPCGTHRVEDETFDITVQIPAGAGGDDAGVPVPLRSLTYVEIELAAPGGGDARYGISSVSIVAPGQPARSADARSVVSA